MSAQVGDRKPALTLLAVTHGAPSVENRAAIVGFVGAVAQRLDDVSVGITFIDGKGGGISRSVESLEGSEAVVVPFVLSAGFHVRTGLALGLEKAAAGPVLADALGPDSRIVGVLHARLEEAGLLPGDSVVLAAAGSNDPRAVKECFETARRLGARLGRPVTVGFIAAAVPRLSDAVSMIHEVHPGTRVVVATYLLAPGAFFDAVRAAQVDVVARPLLEAGAPVPEGLVDLVVDRYVSAEGAAQPVSRVP